MDIERPKSNFPLPETAKKVFQGEIFSVYQWQQEMFDGSHATFEKLARPDTAVIVPVTPEGKIIILDEVQPNTEPKVTIPSGRIEPGEDVLAAAKRELIEETGCEASEWELWMATQPVNKIDWALYTFVARGCKKVAEQNLDSGERIEVREVDFDQFVDLAANKMFGEQAVSWEVLRAKLDPARMAELKKRILG